MQFPGLGIINFFFPQSALIIISEGHFAVIIITTSAGSVTTLVSDRPRPAQNTDNRRYNTVDGGVDRGTNPGSAMSFI